MTIRPTDAPVAVRVDDDHAITSADPAHLAGMIWPRGSDDVEGFDGMEAPRGRR